MNERCVWVVEQRAKESLSGNWYMSASPVYYTRTLSEQDAEAMAELNKSNEYRSVKYVPAEER